MKRLLPLLLILIITSSCKTALLRIAGFRTPGIESEESVITYLKKAKQDQKTVLTIDSTLLRDLQSKPFKPGWKPSFRPMQIRVYDKKFSPVMHWASCEGYLKDLKTFDTVPPRNKINLDSTLNLQQDLDRYFTLDGSHANIKAEPGYDYYIIVCFALFTHRYSRKIFDQVDEYIGKKPEYKFKVYLVNTDVMDWWNTELVSEITIH